MSYRYWLVFGSLALGAAQIVACSSPSSSCEAKLRCPAGGASGMAGAAGADDEQGEAGAEQAGKGGLGAQGGKPGVTDDAGEGGIAGEPSIETELELAEPTLAAGKTYVPFTAKLSASGATHYEWSIASGTLPAGLTLQGVQSATVTITGTPTEAGQFPFSLSVTDGATRKAVDVTLAITHSALFLSDRNTAGVNEIFVTEIGAATAAAPIRLSATIPLGGGVSSYSWSPDGSKVLYLASQSSGGATELWVASLAAPGTAQRVSAPGITVSQMVWLLSGNIAAYTTSAGDAYLVDLSGLIPGASKLAVSGPATPRSLTPSPDGSSLIVDNTVSFEQYALTSVSWAGGAPKSVTFGPAGPVNTPTYSYDGHYGIANSLSGGKWWDFSSVSPMAATLAAVDFSFSWSPNAEAVLYAYTELGSSGPTGKMNLSRAVFDGGSVDATVLVAASTCSLGAASWSPDGKHGLFRCSNELRGIGNVVTARVGTDFSLLPSSYLANAFTDIPTVGWSPDSKWITFRADRDANNQYDLHLIRWSAPGVAHKAHANTVGAGVSNWSFAPSSQSVAFVGTIAPQTNAGLYLTQLPGSGAPPTATLISAPANATVQTDINWLPGSRVITYRATFSGAAQLFAVPVAADGTAGTAIPVSGVSGSGVTCYQLAPTH
jgi:putative Ig domain-containing protein/WD40 repeat protein